MNATKIDVYLRFVTLSWIIFGAVIWGIFAATDYNIVSRIARGVGIPKISRIIYGAIGVAAVIFYFKYLNDVIMHGVKGQDIIPITLIKQSYPPNYNMTKELEVPEHAKYVIYWGAESETDVPVGSTFEEAYQDMTNVGSMDVGDYGKVKIKFKDPTKYQCHMCPKGVTKGKHIHYRWLNGIGSMGPIHTLWL